MFIYSSEIIRVGKRSTEHQTVHESNNLFVSLI